MTRAEAIEILKQLRLDYVEFWEETNNQYVKAYNMAIASLETDEAYQLEYEPTTKNDLGVDRKDAVERLNAIKQFIGYDKDSEIVKATQKSLDMAISALEHPERNVVAVVPCGDAISRAEAIDTIRQLYLDLATQKAVIDLLKILPSVTPQEPRWIPVKFRPLTDEEKDEYPDYCYMADCQMPDDGEEILVCTEHGSVEKDECGFEDGFYLDSGYDWQTDIVAWMPLPKPYEPQESEE